MSAQAASSRGIPHPPTTPDERRQAAPPRTAGPGEFLAVLLSGGIVLHLVAIFLPAFSIPPSPRVVRDAYWALRFYPQAIYMDHGYHFFGPDPGDSTLIRYVARGSDGRVRRGSFPTKKTFPRLRYHRHFMLTEAMPRIADYDPETYRLLIETYARQIAERFDAERVELYRVTHRMTSAERYLAGGRLDDPETYFEEYLGSFSWPRPISPAKEPTAER